MKINDPWPVVKKLMPIISLIIDKFAYSIFQSVIIVKEKFEFAFEDV